MHSLSIDHWTHDHVFLGSQHKRHERRTWFVVVLTATMMVGEISVGWFSGSMALLADGWHMATHAAALGIAALAYWFARRHVGNSHFTFGTGKFGDLAAFSSAIILAMIAVQVAYESVTRLMHPVPIAYSEAIAKSYRRRNSLQDTRELGVGTIGRDWICRHGSNTSNGEQVVLSKRNGPVDYQ